MYKLFSVVLIGLVLTGCSSRSEFYRLEAPMPGTGSRPISQRAVVGVARIQLADYLRQKEIVTRQGERRLDLHEHSYWAGDLDRNIQTALARTLSRSLSGVTVLRYPWEEPLNDRYRIYLSVDRFDADCNTTATMSGRWSLIEPGSGRLLAGEEFRYDAPLERSRCDLDRIVAAQSRLVQRLGTRIAKRLRPYLR